jgi:hypothetical protein
MDELTVEIKDCVEGGAGTCRNADEIEDLRAMIIGLLHRAEKRAKGLESALDEIKETWIVRADGGFYSGEKMRKIAEKALGVHNA